MANVRGRLLSVKILRTATILKIECTTLRGDVLLLAVGAEILYLVQWNEAEFCIGQLVGQFFNVCHFYLINHEVSIPFSVRALCDA